MPTLIKTIGNINNGAVTWNNAAGSAVIGSVTNAGAWTLGATSGANQLHNVNGTLRIIISPSIAIIVNAFFLGKEFICPSSTGELHLQMPSFRNPEITCI